MEIVVKCKCGRELTAPGDAVGLKGTCPSCGRKFIIGQEQPQDSPAKPKKQRDPATVPEALAPASASRVRHLFYWALLVALSPLAWYTFRATPPGEAFEDRLRDTLRTDPEVRAKLRQVYALHNYVRDKDLFEAIPSHRIRGALLPYDTHVHWLYAAAAMIAFLGVLGLGF